MADMLNLITRFALQSGHDIPLRVAITGHRHFGDDTTTTFVMAALDSLLAQLQNCFPQGLIALSGMAVGADSLFAWAALRRSIDLEACLAFTTIEEDFAPGQERDSFLELLARSHFIHTLPFASRSNAAYMALGCWLVDASDLLIGVWNGLPAAGEGGTGDVIAYAQKQGRCVIHIHTLRHTIMMLENQPVW